MQNLEGSDEMKRNNWFLIPYIKEVSEKFKNIAHGLESKLAFFSLNKLDRIIKSQKAAYHWDITRMLSINYHVKIVIPHMLVKQKEN